MLYIYEASDEDGAISKGEIEASSVDAVVEFLTSRSLVPVSVRVKGEKLKQPNLPASFNVLLKTLRGLALNVELIKSSRLIDQE
jgi:type II secretory pathway component PulF